MRIGVWMTRRPSAGPAEEPPDARARTRPGVLARRPLRGGVRALAAGAAVCVVIAAMSGCAARVTAAAPSLAVSSAYVPLPATASPGTTVAFLDIRNGGGPDRLVGARTSAGGKVVFTAPVAADAATTTTIRAISIPARTTVRLLPDDAHLLITGARHLQAGRDITLTLTFARAGTMSVTAVVIDPQSGGVSYFAN